ncbi:uncharacterized protein LOC129597297 [Paramacrobiotus metropolitanus]|uniref:uncharacterized protein LOC129597297 n=1 Tax=Paramacrobiotus metropolitanus TaxID=2943436 RepID=UPI00244636CF|nr:uncharacterized protein LOC129597297 [Paramacrobiotus metropolitanus]
MTAVRNLLKGTRSLLELSVAEVVLAVLGFAANLYSLFYGAFLTVNDFPTLQLLAFIATTLVYVLQLVSGGYLIVSCIRVLRGLRDPARFGRNHGERHPILCIFCGLYLLLLIVFGVIQFSERARHFVPSLSVWGAVHQVFRTEPIGQLVLLGLVVILAVEFVLAMFLTARSKDLYEELEREKNAATLLVHLESQDSAPTRYKGVQYSAPPPYKGV